MELSLVEVSKTVFNLNLAHTLHQSKKKKCFDYLLNLMC